GSGKPGPVTLALQKIFFDIARGNVARHLEWRTTVAPRPV
ncbi:hypothetical protein B1A_12952, partial [mine drainage metagenome]